MLLTSLVLPRSILHAVQFLNVSWFAAVGKLKYAKFSIYWYIFTALYSPNPAIDMNR